MSSTALPLKYLILFQNVDDGQRIMTRYEMLAFIIFKELLSIIFNFNFLFRNNYVFTGNYKDSTEVTYTPQSTPMVTS